MTTPQKLIRNNKKYPNEIAISYLSHGQWNTMTWSEFYNYTLRIAKSLSSISTLISLFSSVTTDSVLDGTLKFPSLFLQTTNTEYNTLFSRFPTKNSIKLT